jgi:hypothetical protein
MKTSNLDLDAVKSFCAWMAEDCRMPDNPLLYVGPFPLLKGPRWATFPTKC